MKLTDCEMRQCWAESKPDNLIFDCPHARQNFCLFGEIRWANWWLPSYVVWLQEMDERWGDEAE